jgi:Ca2+-transporting ATPase
VFASVALGLGQPLTTRHLLWINLLSDIFPELAFALEPGRDGLLDRAPRGATAHLMDTRDRGRLATQSLVMAASALSAYGFDFRRDAGGVRSTSRAFVSLAAAQLFHALTVRSSTAAPPDAPAAAISVGQATAAGVTLLLTGQLWPGLGRLLGIVPLKPVDLLISAAAAVASLGANELIKAAWTTEPSAVAGPLVVPAPSTT